MPDETTREHKIGIALLSFAHAHQRSWGTVFSQRSDATVIGSWDDDQPRGEAHAKAIGVDFFPQLDELLGRDDVHAVTICSENATHAELAVKAAAAGCTPGQCLYRYTG